MDLLNFESTQIPPQRIFHSEFEQYAQDDLNQPLPKSTQEVEELEIDLFDFIDPMIHDPSKI